MFQSRIQIKPITTTKTKTKTTLSYSSQFTPKCNNLKPPSQPKPSLFSFKPITITSSSNSPNPPPSLTSLLHSIPDWADTIKERGMQKNRILYTHSQWLLHRSSLRHLRHFLSSLSSRVILSLVPPVLFFTAFAAVIAAYNSAVTLHHIPHPFPLLHASSLPYQLTAPALALLLVFRTEASYARFVEGKKAWTNIIAGTQDFATQVMASVRSSGDLAIKKALLKYIVAFPLALKVTVVFMFVGFLSSLVFLFFNDNVKGVGEESILQL